MSLRVTSPSYTVSLDGSNSDSNYMEYVIERGDTRPALSVTLLEDDSPLDDLTEARKVTFRMGTYSEVLFEKRAAIVDRSEGKVEYRWDDGETDKPGKYKGQFRVHYRNGETLTLPTDETLFVNITSQIGH